MRYGFIYETTNNITGMKYIGKHKRSQDPSDPDDSCYLGSGKYISHAIDKYGREHLSQKYSVYKRIGSLCRSLRRSSRLEYCVSCKEGVLHDE